MGYTHYWKRPVKNAGTAFMFGKLSLDVKTLCEYANAAGIRIRNGVGESEPEFNEGYFSLNGDASHYVEGRDLAHETFYWAGIPTHPNHREGEPEFFSFCKTAMKPYDAVVTAILIRAKVIYGSCVSVSSDGEWDSGDWDKGRELYSQVFGELAPCPFDKVSA